MSLVINYIEIENFKSYYGKNILGPFHQSFNAVIGPNGSGKSNVIDSLLFVFGFRAQKIRTKKISVLIHNSDKYPNLTSCSVTIFFRKIKETGPNKFEVIPNSEFTVKRTAHKDNSSEYYLDGRKVQFKEVGALLRDCGVDLDHNRFLILQGEVEQISLLKPKAANEHEEGLLEYLEDIIGTIKYKPMLEEVSAEIDRANEIRTEKANRVQSLQSDKTKLEGPRNEALNYLKLENKLIETKNMYYQLKIHETNESVRDQKEQFAETEKQFDELNKKLDELKRENETKSGECAIKKKELDKKTRACEKLKKKAEELEKEDVEMKESLKHANESIKKLEKNIGNETEKVEKLRDLPEKNEKRIEELNEELAELEGKREPANKLIQTRMEEVNAETLKYQEKKNALQENLTKLQSDANDAKSKMEVAESELDVFLKSQNYDKDKLDEVRTKLEESAKTAIEKENSINELEKKLPGMEKELKKKSTELDEVTGKERQMSETLGRRRQKFAEAQSSFSNNRSRNKVLQFLNQLKAEGKLDGFYGRLGDLGAIDERYDVAISTACGALDHMIVDTIDTAQRCVEFLKQSGVGAATFIALDKQEKWREHVSGGGGRRMQFPENAQRLIDLIQVNDPKFLTAFYYSLRNTLVADDLDQARRIAYNHSQRHRVVTLKGEIIEVSGTMSGGGQPLRGRMGSRIVEEFSAEKIRSMQEVVRADETELRALVDRRNELEPHVHTLRGEIERARADVARLKTELSAARDQIKEYKKFESVCVRRAQEAVRDDQRQKKLEETVRGMREQFERADELAAKLRDENSALHEKIVEISKRILDEPKAQLKKIESRIEEASKEITALTVETKASKRNLVNSEKKLRSMSDELETHRASVGKCESRLAAIEEERGEATSECERLSGECAECESELKELSRAVKQTETQTQKLEAERIDVKHKLDGASEKLQHAEHQVKSYESHLSALKLHNLRELERLGRDSTSMAGGGAAAEYELKRLDEDDLTGLELTDLEREIHRLKESLAAQTPNLTAIQNYKELELKFMERMSELEQIVAEHEKLLGKYEEIRKRRFDEFMTGFTEIRLKLKEIYRTVTIEGDAELELVDSMDPFTEGIVLSVRPPKKSWKNVSNLSGGEKTLSSLSLVFALHEFRATPIYVMDEIDAALDFKNVSIIAHYIKERTKNAQFIIISLRNNMFELCNRLFGIYKVRNCTSAAFIAPELLELEDKRNAAVKKDPFATGSTSRTAITSSSSTSSATTATGAGVGAGGENKDSVKEREETAEAAASAANESVLLRNNLNTSNVQTINV